jgi:protein tyrosine phosphatase (PTP) superfamily phosphohydrolase (DUF442 family)
VFTPVGPVQPGSFSSSFEPPLARPGGPRVRLYGPEPMNPEAEADPARPSPPQTPEPPLAPPPVVRDGGDATPPAPVDIPQFAFVKEGVATGQQPFPDGIRWLADHRYRTVLYVRAPGEDDGIPRKVFEKRGLHFVSLELSPTTLSKEVVAQFNALVADAKNRPLFVYDRDGSLAGGLWYLYFRTSEGMSDEKARAEAERLGFQTEGGAEQRTMWIAIQNYLRKLNP